MLAQRNTILIFKNGQTVKHFATIFLSLYLFSSCTKYKPKTIDTAVKSKATYVIGSKEFVGARAWWLQSKSSSLNRLVEQAFCGSPDIQEVFLRLESSVLVARQAGASKWPTITGRVGVSQNYNYEDSKTNDYHEFSRGFMASYELDIFGKIKNKSKIASEGVVQATLDLTTAKLSLVTEIVTHWYAYQNYLHHLGLLEEQIKWQKLICDELDRSYKRGVSTFESQARAKKSLLQLEEDKKDIRKGIQLEKLLLSRLVGQEGFIEVVLYDKELEFIDAPNSGFPADLLRNRPDLQKAESAYKQALLSWKVAKAERLPSLSLSISSDNRAGKIKDLFDNWLLSFAANIASTIFDGGYRKQEVKKAEKAIELEIQKFKKVYLDAVLEVNQLLVTIDWANKSFVDISEQLRLQKDLVTIKDNEYRKGLVGSSDSYLEKINFLQQKRLLLNAKYSLNELHIDLYRAIGGDWFEVDEGLISNDSKSGDVK